MRNALVRTLVELADSDESIVFLTGDLGYTVIEPFAERFPDRFLNVGVAEQNMLGLAAGLAASGQTPFAYSIATFASMRGYEHFRNGALAHNLPVRLVGVGGGLDYGTNGITHFALEDLALMRAQPRLAVLAPADAEQTRAAVLALGELPGPAYLRLGKGGRTVPGLGGRFRFGRIETLVEGDDLAIVACGPVASEAVEAAERLQQSGLSVTVAVAASLAPAPVDDLAELLARVPLVVSVEAHYLNGGLGSLVCEVAAEHGLGTRVVRRGVPEMPTGATGSAGFMNERYGLSAAGIADGVLSELELRR